MIVYQQGGVTVPVNYYTPLPMLPETPAQQTVQLPAEAGSDDKGLKIKDILGMLKDAGDMLPTDSNLIYSYFTDYFKQLDTFNSLNSGSAFTIGSDPFSPTGLYSTGKLASMYVQGLQKIKIAKFNLDKYNKAYDLIKSKDGLHEVAITDTGKLIVTDAKGNLKQMSLDNYKKLQDKYLALTNSELLYLRAENPLYAYNNQLISVVENGTGMKTINDLIKSSLQSLGNTTIEQEGINWLKTQEILNGVLALRDAYAELGDSILAGTSGSSNKGKSVHVIKDGVLTKDSKQQAEFAINYIYSMLPDNAKTLLKYKTGSENGAKQLITSMVASGMNYEHREKMSSFISENLNSGAGNGSGSGGSEAIKDTFITQVQRGIGGTVENFTLNKGTNANLTISGTRYYNISKDGKTVGRSSLRSMLDESGMGSIVNSEHIYMGERNAPLSESELENIMYNGTGGIRVLLPIAKGRNGEMQPDFSILDEYNNLVLKPIEADLKAGRLTPGSAEMYKRMAEKMKAVPSLKHLVNNDGSLNMANLQPYFVTEGVFSSYNINVSDEDKKYLYKYSGDEEGEIKNELSTYLGSKVGGKFRPKDVGSTWIRDFYRTSIFIPISSTNFAQGSIGSGQKLGVNTDSAIDTNYRNLEKRRTMGNTSSNFLNDN